MQQVSNVLHASIMQYFQYFAFIIIYIHVINNVCITMPQLSSGKLGDMIMYKWFVKAGCFVCLVND